MKPTPGNGVGFMGTEFDCNFETEISNLTFQIFEIHSTNPQLRNHDFLRSSSLTGYPCSSSFGAYLATFFWNFPMHMPQQK